MKGLIKKLFRSHHWEEAGQGWEGLEDTLTLAGWSRARRVVVLRRKLTGEMLLTGKEDRQDEFAFIEGDIPTARYEYAALVTPTQHEILTLAQLYRDRADAGNNFDELKNQWGWGGFTTQDLALAYHGAQGGLGLQRVDAVRQARPPAQTLRGDRKPAAVAAWRGHANAARRADASDHHQHAYKPF